MPMERTSDPGSVDARPIASLLESVPRPLQAPRPKRFSEDEAASQLELAMAAKRLKLPPHPTRGLIVKTLPQTPEPREAPTSPADATPHTPERSTSGPAPTTPTKATSSTALALVGIEKKAIVKALDIFADFWMAFVYNREWKDEDVAAEIAEKKVGERYDELCCALADVLPWIGPEEEDVAEVESPCGCKYTTVEIRGCNKYQFRNSLEDHEKLQCMKDETRTGHARGAFAAILSVLSSRKEKIWLEAFDTEEDTLEWLREHPFKTRRLALATVLEELAERETHGYFATALVHPASKFRVAFSQDVPLPLPACMLVTYELPMRRALEKMDAEGPFREGRNQVTWKWCQNRKRQFALQDIQKGEQMGTRKERRSACELTPEPKIAELMRSRADVVMLDAIAALAPRDISKKHGLSAIVKAELEGLLRTAKSNGQAVVFMLGGDHTLAEKVYLQKPFTDYGLRCGYLRWRSSKKTAWARERSTDIRVCIGLQLP